MYYQRRLCRRSSPQHQGCRRDIHRFAARARRTRAAGTDDHRRRGGGVTPMVTVDTIEGTIDDRYDFHYDLFADVLYIRLLSAQDVETVGDLTDDGDILLRDEQTDAIVGVTVISWWKRCGRGTRLDS